MSRILIVEDHEDLAFGLRRTLEFEGHEVVVAEDGAAGLERARSWTPDLVVLDVMLREMNGFEVLRALRRTGSAVPVLVLTARGEESDLVVGLDSGADDYVTKPFGTLELLARVRALLRRAGGEGGAARRPLERFGNVEVDPASLTVLRAGEPVSLSPKEFDLLVALLGRRGAVASRTELLAEVSEYANPNVGTRTVDIHVAELRRKLEEDPSRPVHILTARQAGYRFRR